MIIEVKQKHIDEGIKMSCYNCPVALAIKEAIRSKSDMEVAVARNRCYIGTTMKMLPPEVSSFIYGFDRHLKVQPFAFFLE